MVFEVGKTYCPADSGFDPIKVIKRTERCIKVDNGTSEWKMVIKVDENGDEYVIDSSVPRKWRSAFVYSAKWVV